MIRTGKNDLEMMHPGRKKAKTVILTLEMLLFHAEFVHIYKISQPKTRINVHLNPL